MMRDPLDLLREANPATVAELAADPVEQAAMQRALQQIVTGPAAAPVRRRRRRLVVVIAVIALLAAAGAYLVSRQKVSKPLDIGCYDAPSLRASAIVVRADAKTDPVQSCRDLWHTGAFGERAEPPGLVACVLPSGAVGVFPGDSSKVCSELGRPAPETTTTLSSGGTGSTGPSASADPIALRDTLVAEFHNRPCLSEAEARRIAEDELRRRGMTDWKVVDREPFTAERPCATLFVQVERRTVLLIPFIRTS